MEEENNKKRYLSRFEPQEELIIHQRLQSPVIFLAILLAPLEVDFPDYPFVCKVALDGNVSSIDQEVFPLGGGDTGTASAVNFENKPAEGHTLLE